MKTVAALCLLVFAVSSCKKEEVIETPAVPATPTPTVFDDFILTMDGLAFTPENVSTNYSGGMIVREGSVSSNAFRLSISDGMQPGFYPIYMDGPFKFEYSQDGFASIYSSYEGSASIVSHDTIANHITGYYNCKLVMPQVPGTVDITKAEFNIYY